MTRAQLRDALAVTFGSLRQRTDSDDWNAGYEEGRRDAAKAVAAVLKLDQPAWTAVAWYGTARLNDQTHTVDCDDDCVCGAAS